MQESVFLNLFRIQKTTEDEYEVRIEESEESKNGADEADETVSMFDIFKDSKAC